MQQTSLSGVVSIEDVPAENINIRVFQNADYSKSPIQIISGAAGAWGVDFLDPHLKYDVSFSDPTGVWEDKIISKISPTLAVNLDMFTDPATLSQYRIDGDAAKVSISDNLLKINNAPTLTLYTPSTKLRGSVSATFQRGTECGIFLGQWGATGTVYVQVNDSVATTSKNLVTVWRKPAGNIVSVFTKSDAVIPSGGHTQIALAHSDNGSVQVFLNSELIYTSAATPTAVLEGSGIRIGASAPNRVVEFSSISWE